MDLTHYVIVRRDLTVGQTCAQIVHAAGESAALYALSSEKERRIFNPEVGGSSPSGRAIREPDRDGVSRAGANPASRAIPLDTIAVVLSVRNASRLLRLTRALARLGVVFVLVREPDLGNEPTAIGIVPCPRDLVGRALKDCVVYAPEPTAEQDENNIEHPAESALY